VSRRAASSLPSPAGAGVQAGVVQDCIQSADQVSGVHVEVAGDLDDQLGGWVAQTAGAVVGEQVRVDA
jgi:hypothetical protein